MRTFPPAALLLLLWGAVACDRVAQPRARPSSPVVTPPAKSAADLPESADGSAVLRLLYGNYDSERKAAIAEAGQPAPRGASADEAIPPTLAKVVGLYRYPAERPEHLLALVAENPEGFDSHGQAPTLAGDLFERVAGGWKLAVRTSAITEIGSYGEAPEGTLVQLGPHRWGVRFDPGFTNMGVTAQGLSLVAPVDAAIVEVLALGELASENSGDCDEAEKNCYSFESEVRFVPGSNPEWLDVEVRSHGTRLNNEMTAEPFDETQRFGFVDGRYRSQESAKR